jgi:hypothetical protein
MGTLHNDIFTFITISPWILLTVRNVLNKSCSENKNTHLCSVTFFSESRAVYEIISKNMLEPERPQMAKWRRVLCWISKATRSQGHASVCAPTPIYARTHTQKYVILSLLHDNSGYVNAPQPYVIRILPVLIRFLHKNCLIIIFYRNM